MKAAQVLDTATFGAGCFWGVEVSFARLPGVVETAVGFMGGHVDDPSYRDVCYRDTGHAEVVHLGFDPSVITYDQLLDVFWSNHDPTTLNRQGPDIGAQYRSVVFFHSAEQEAAARASLNRQKPNFKLPIVTQIAPALPFYRAEDYHQRYLEKRGLTHCHI